MKTRTVSRFYLYMGVECPSRNVSSFLRVSALILTFNAIKWILHAWLSQYLLVVSCLSSLFYEFSFDSGGDKYGYKHQSYPYKEL